MTIINKNEKRTISTRESKKGKEHLVVRTKKEKLSAGEQFDKKMKKAANKFKL